MGSEKEYELRLFDLFKEGDERAFNEFYNIKFNIVKRSIMKKMKNVDKNMAEDVAIETFTNLFKNKDKIKTDNINRFNSYIFTSAFNKLIDKYRKNNPKKGDGSRSIVIMNYSDINDLYDDNDKGDDDILYKKSDNTCIDIEQYIDNKKIFSLIDKEINKAKKEKIRKILKMNIFEEKRPKEISSELNIKESSVKATISRQKKKIINKLKGIC